MFLPLCPKMGYGKTTERPCFKVVLNLSEAEEFGRSQYRRAKNLRQRVMMHIIEIAKMDGVPDAEGGDARHGIADLGIEVPDVRVDQVYLLEGSMSAADLKRVADKVLLDPIIETAVIRKGASLPRQRRFKDSVRAEWSVLKTFHHGVTDNVGQTTLEAIHNLGTKNVVSVMTAKRYRVSGRIPFSDISKIATRFLSNPLIESCVIEKTGGGS